MPRLLLALALLLATPLSSARADGDSRLPLLGAMRSELDRTMKQLRLADYEPPYFVAYVLRDYDKHEVVAKLGSLLGSDANHERHAAVEVRVGSYQLDNSATSGEELELDPPDYEPSADAPIDANSDDALRATLWLLTDARYKQALGAYAKKRGKRATQLSEDESLPSFAREPSVKRVEPAQPITFDSSKMEARARTASARFKKFPEIFDGDVRIGAERMTRYLVNSEGGEQIAERVIWSTIVSAVARAPDGMLLQHEKAFYTASPDALPDDATLVKSIDELASEIFALSKAPTIDPYTGPAILMQQAAGVFFHEAVGHRLEGERQNDEKEGRTFKGQIGHRILPEFLSVDDDPTLRTAAGETLNGYYRVDDEGVEARPVTLIDKGVLRDYLMSRTPITGSIHSNGHGRAEGVADPMGRMANLIVRSAKKVSDAELKKMLLAEVRKQGKPFGLLIRDITGGSTNTSNYGFQAFKGQPRLVYKVDAKTGAETLVRGVEMVGTPLASISRIVATGDHDGVFNGYCGAESGFVPVSTVAPSILMTEIELQRSDRALERPPILAPPWKGKDATIGK